MSGKRTDEINLPGTPLEKLLTQGEFRFQRLLIEGMGNEAVFEFHGPDLADEEINLFHKSVSSGDEYVALLANRLISALDKRLPLPVVRFADGEYAFYEKSLKCNGLYKQAEGVEAIQDALPFHVSALRELANAGVLAPLVFPRNIRRINGLRRLFRKKRYNDQAIRFLEFIKKNGVALTESNYIPFYVVYAYLSSTGFAAAMDGKALCIVNPDFNDSACASWFKKAGSSPYLYHVPIPECYVATQWNSFRDEVLRTIPENPDCFMVGAGVGALQVCVELSRLFSVPAIDSGHILNMMNDLQWKSGGPRLFTYQ
ncbi:MAG: hypothetical protein AB9866_10620 [Syntrophobacteraceae bacterium]